MRILLLEPDHVLGKTYAQALRDSGHDVSVCPSAQTAIFSADDKRPDLVIVELQLVGHSGVEFLYEFRSYEDWRGIPVLVLSSVPPIEFKGAQKILQQELGVQDYLYKPTTSLKGLIKAASKFASIKA